MAARGGVGRRVGQGVRGGTGLRVRGGRRCCSAGCQRHGASLAAANWRVDRVAAAAVHADAALQLRLRRQPVDASGCAAAIWRSGCRSKACAAPRAAMFNEFGVLWLLAPIGLFLAPAALRAFALDVDSGGADLRLRAAAGSRALEFPLRGDAAVIAGAVSSAGDRRHGGRSACFAHRQPPRRRAADVRAGGARRARGYRW